MKKLILIKAIHTLVWIFFNIVLAYLFYATISNRITIWVWISIGLFALEGLVLLIFRMTCPLTLLVRRYADSDRDNFDIYLPNWLARYTKLIYTTLLGIVIVILLYRLL